MKLCGKVVAEERAAQLGMGSLVCSMETVVVACIVRGRCRPGLRQREAQ